MSMEHLRDTWRSLTTEAGRLQTIAGVPIEYEVASNGSVVSVTATVSLDDIAGLSASIKSELNYGNPMGELVVGKLVALYGGAKAQGDPRTMYRIQYIEVQRRFKHQGIATEMFRRLEAEARSNGGFVVHDDDISDDAKAWIRSLPSGQLGIDKPTHHYDINHNTIFYDEYSLKRLSALGGRRLWWRFHPTDREFMPEAASSVEIHNWRGRNPKPGFSALPNPWMLFIYASDHGWATEPNMPNRGVWLDDVIGFTGEIVGRGGDAEPLVMPDMKIVERYSWGQFVRELLDTPFPSNTHFDAPGSPGYGEWRDYAESLAKMEGKSWRRTDRYVGPIIVHIIESWLQDSDQRKVASGQVREMGTSPLKYDTGTKQRIGIIDLSAPPCKPGDSYFTSERIEDGKSRRNRERWDAAPDDAKPTKRKPAPKYQEDTGTAPEGLVAFLDWHASGDEIYIDFMSTRKDQRGKGHSEALVRWVYAKAEAEGRVVNWGRVFYDAQSKFTRWSQQYPRTRGKFV